MGRYVIGDLERRLVAGKPVFVAESHQMVLEGWAEVRRGMSETPHLVTLDFHTDLRKAFTLDCFNAYDAGEIDVFPGPEEALAHMAPLVERLAGLDPAEVKELVGRLTFEEHIDAAQRAGIVDHVFLGLSDRPGIPPEGKQHAVWKRTDERAEADTVLEPAFLGELVAKLEEVAGRPLEETVYILDVDLDYFRTAKAIRPDDPSVFRRLVRHAKAVTVALEPECVKDGRLPKEKITAKSLLADLLGHIEAAMA